MNSWKDYPETKPEVSGYYYAYYYNPQPEHECWLYKALWYNVKEAKWQGPWPWSYDRVPAKTDDGRDIFRIIHRGLNVKAYRPETYHEFYVPSSMAAEKDWRKYDV